MCVCLYLCFWLSLCRTDSHLVIKGPIYCAKMAGMDNVGVWWSKSLRLRLQEVHRAMLMLSTAVLIGPATVLCLSDDRHSLSGVCPTNMGPRRVLGALGS